MNKPIIPLIGYRLGLMIAGGISTGLLGGALLFQYVGGLAPCSLCIWQRWPHLAVMILAFIGLRGIMPRLMLQAYPYQRGDQCGAWRLSCWH
jgi:disulfide bond formation protein DsbB